MEGRDPAKLGRAQGEAIREALTRLFGTPDDPKVPPGVDLNLAMLQMAAGPVGGDEKGNQRGLFRRHCVACHGLAGDGAGPAALLLSPYPRDFRTGTFKFTSTAGGAKPCRDDLRLVLLRGVPGTAMPSQVTLPENEREALIEYVKYLSIRGQTELYLLQLVIDEDAYLPLDVQEVLREGVIPAAQAWSTADSLVVHPPEPPPINTPEQMAASVALGKQYYSTKDSQCVKCHGPEGKGDGEESEVYDDWNKPKKGVNASQTERLSRLYTLPIQKVRPRDFTEGTFRGGASPRDLYLRIHVGIKGTPMPAAGPAPGSKGVLTPEQIWHVVNYVRWFSEGKKPRGEPAESPASPQPSAPPVSSIPSRP